MKRPATGPTSHWVKSSDRTTDSAPDAHAMERTLEDTTCMESWWSSQSKAILTYGWLSLRDGQVVSVCCWLVLASCLFVCLFLQALSQRDAPHKNFFFFDGMKGSGVVDYFGPKWLTIFPPEEGEVCAWHIKAYTHMHNTFGHSFFQSDHLSMCKRSPPAERSTSVSTGEKDLSLYMFSFYYTYARAHTHTQHRRFFSARLLEVLFSCLLLSDCPFYVSSTEVFLHFVIKLLWTKLLAFSGVIWKWKVVTFWMTQ